MGRRFVYRPLIGFALFIALAAALIAWRRVASRLLAFDSRSWKAAPERHSSLRFRMADDLIRRMKEERWDRERVLAELGSSPEAAERSMTFSIGERPSLLPQSTFYFRVDFDESAHVANAWYAPE